jgi:hypothetical protein
MDVSQKESVQQIGVDQSALADGSARTGAKGAFESRLERFIHGSVLLRSAFLPAWRRERSPERPTLVPVQRENDKWIWRDSLWHGLALDAGTSFKKQAHGVVRQIRGFHFLYTAAVLRHSAEGEFIY